MAVFLGIIVSSIMFFILLAKALSGSEDRYQKLLRALSFLFFLSASFISLSMGSPNEYSVPVAALGMAIFYISLIFDNHSHLKYTAPLPFLSLFLFKGHELLLSLSILDAVALLELAYSDKHRGFIPLVTALVVVAIAEYFVVFGPELKTDSLVAPVLYIFAASIFMLWIIFYLASKFIKTMREE